VFIFFFTAEGGCATRIRKAPGMVTLGLFVKSGIHLLSHNRSTIGRYDFTSVFGMGTGVSRNVFYTANATAGVSACCDLYVKKVIGKSFC